MRRRKGFTLIELVMTIAIVGVMASAFVSLFVPQIQLFLYLPTNLRVQEASSLMMETMVNGKMTVIQTGTNRVATFVPGLKYAEPAAATGKLITLTGITFADPDEVRYTYFDTKRVMHTVRIFLDANNNSMVRLIDTEAQSDLKIISSGGARSTGGVQIRTGENNGAGTPSIFRYYQTDGTELTGTLTAAERNSISRIDIAFIADTGNGNITSYQASTIKRSSVSIKRRFYPEPGEWEFQFARQNADTLPDLFAVKKHDGGTAAGSTFTEVHAFNAASTAGGFDAFGAEIVNATVNLDQAGALDEAGDQFDLLIADCGSAASRTPDGTPDLVAIQKILINPAFVGLRVFNGTNLGGAPTVNITIGSAVASRRLANGLENYKFGMANYRPRGGVEDATNTQDLFVASLNAGTTQVRIYNGAGNYTNWFAASGDGPFSTLMPTINATTNLWSDWDFFFVRWNNDTHPDMVAIHKKRTASGNVEVVIFDGQPRASSSVSGTPSNMGRFRFRAQLANFTVADPARTPISTGAGNNLDFKVADWNNDNTPDILCVQRNKTVPGSTVVRILSGVPNIVGADQLLNTVLLQTGTAMPEVDSGKSVP